MQKDSGIVAQDYGTNCKDCERYRKLGDVCVVEHGKKFLWEYCRDFEPQVVLPDYRELMRSVRVDQALERKKEKEKKERERKKKLKERAEKEEERKKKHKARLRKRRETLKKRLLKEKEKSAKTKPLAESKKVPTVDTAHESSKPSRKKKSGKNLEISSDDEESSMPKPPE